LRITDGIEEGVRCEPFNYTGQTLLGVPEFEREVTKELNRVMDKKGQWLNKGGYKGRYPETWRQEVVKVVNKSQHKRCVTDLMDHIVAESTKIYAGTDMEDKFLIFHDGLTQWWEVQAQAYLDAKGFKNRQLCCIGDTNIGTRYYQKVVGDSPELCRALDSFGFADLMRCVNTHVALTSVYAVDDVRRFKMGTPAEVWYTLTRCWEIEPTSARIIEDIKALPRVLDVLIENKGAVVQDPEDENENVHAQSTSAGFFASF
jgi:hypothetical protein